ncbi:uncharacterized protein DUF2384 [Sulfurirhabdus autotrophica]|uniref:Uncharacterized protein DUF2384 n=1 Tax=Sulfurirhabdus autotrophica TaxID=1706046 RepID=A0A4R3XQ16_9PROT|nr:uncharacterized protein DUF2384 [Sulfurirhabdus autotrophica]
METNWTKADLMAKAIQTLGSERNASEWIKNPNIALGGNSPLEIIGTPDGKNILIQIFSNIERGGSL